MRFNVRVPEAENEVVGALKLSVWGNFRIDYEADGIAYRSRGVAMPLAINPPLVGRLQTLD